MYLPRAQGSNHGSQGMKFSVADACDKIKEEITNLQQQYHQLKIDYEKVIQEKNEMQRHNAMYYEITCSLNLEMHRQSELAKRLVVILNNVMPFLTQDHQSQVAATIERAKQVSITDLMTDDKFPKLPNGAFGATGGGGGMPPEGMDLYKLMASSGLMPHMPPMTGGLSSPSSSSNKHSVPMPSSSNGPSGGPNAMANFLAQNPAALAQAMASFGGGAQPPQPPPPTAAPGPSSSANPLLNNLASLTAMMTEKGIDDKQRAAAAMAAFAGLFPPGMPPSQQQQLFNSMEPSQLAALMAAIAGGPAALMPPGPAVGGSSRPPEEKRRKLGEHKLDEDYMKHEHDTAVDASRTPYKARRSPSNMENGDNTKTEISFSIGQNRSRTSTPNHLLNEQQPMTPSSARARKPPQASTPNSRPTSTSSPHTGGEYPPRNVSNPAADGTGSRTHSPALSSSSAPSASAYGSYKKPAASGDLASNGNGSTPPPPPSKQHQNGMANGLDGGYRINKAPYAFMVMPCVDGSITAPTPVPLTPELFVGPGLPRGLKIHSILDHGEVVCAVTISADRRHIFTGGRGAVKMWDSLFLDESSAASPMASSNDESEPQLDVVKTTSSTISRGHKVYKDCLMPLDCLHKDNYIRSIKLSKDGKTLIVGGESKILSIWDLGAGQMPVNKGVLTSNATACYALTLSQDGRLCYSCTSEGQICVWDVCNQTLVREFQGHADGASCVELYGDQLWTGGLDQTVHCWDVRRISTSTDAPSPGSNNNSSTVYPIYNYTFPSQVFSLGYSGEWLAVGLEKRLIELISPSQEPRYQLAMHENCVLSLKFSHNKQWFASTGKDHFINTWRSPFGANLCQMKENSSVLSCDISSDDRFLITGSGEMRATIYDVMY